jgi:hypothetical protein
MPRNNVFPDPKRFAVSRRFDAKGLQIGKLGHELGSSYQDLPCVKTHSSENLTKSTDPVQSAKTLRPKPVEGSKGASLHRSYFENLSTNGFC